MLPLGRMIDKLGMIFENGDIEDINTGSWKDHSKEEQAKIQPFPEFGF